MTHPRANNARTTSTPGPPAARTPTSGAMAFVAAVFLGAWLLFAVQPMAAKLILPLLGGSPGVWNTVMLFFQGLLLAGYASAHWLGERPARMQPIVLLGVGAAAALMLPIGLPTGERWLPGAHDSPQLAALVLLGLSVGAPAFLLCTVSPIVARWFSISGARGGDNPWFLYAASNAGSMLGLLSYPLLVEPNLTLSQQRWAWSMAYGVLLALLGVCGFVIATRGGRPAAHEPRHGARVPAPAASDAPASSLTPQRLRWVALALVPASLSMAVTQYLSTDVAAAPFLWVLPLSIYLLTFIIAFSGLGPRASVLASWMLGPAVVLVAVLFIREQRTPIVFVMAAHLTLLLCAGLACHGRLASEKPDVARLTEFYLLMSLGGVLAGVFNTLWAPNLFDSVAEYPIMMAAACLLRPALDTKAGGPRWKRALWWGLPALVIPVYFIASSPTILEGWLDWSMRQTMIWALPAALALAVLWSRAKLALAVAAMLFIPTLEDRARVDILLTVRTFFGVHRVMRFDIADASFHALWHGRTVHGVQRLGEAYRSTPLSYYTRSGPMGDVFAELERRAQESGARQAAACVGLGAGALAAYGRPGLAMTFYEIDPIVKEIASNQSLFSYLEASRSPIDFVLGDARITLSRAPDASYDLIVIDAFSSDAIPVHLLTREALQLYFRKLKPGGMLALHISNIFLDLWPVVSALARDQGLAVIHRFDADITDKNRSEYGAGKDPSHWVVLARQSPDLGSLMMAEGWRTAASESSVPSVRPWTDDYSDVLGAVRWRAGE